MYGPGFFGLIIKQASSAQDFKHEEGVLFLFSNVLVEACP